MPQPSGAWKKIIDQHVLEKAQMKTSFESEIRLIGRKFFFRQMSYWLFIYASSKLTHRYNTRANPPRIMEHLEQENRELKEEIDRLTAMMESVLAAQSQSSPTHATPLPQRTVISEVATSTMPATQFAVTMSAEFPRECRRTLCPKGPTDVDVSEGQRDIQRVHPEVERACRSDQPSVGRKRDDQDFLKTLSSFYYEQMIASVPSDITEKVNMGMRLEEGVHEGRLSKEEVSSSKKYASNFARKKEGETNAVSVGRKMRPHVRRSPQPRQHHHQNFERKKVSLDPIPMSYAELYPSLVLKNLLQPRNSLQIPEPLPWWYKPELCCAFHQGAPGHDIENFYPLKYEVQKLVKSGMVSFEDCAPNVKANPLPAHGNPFVNMVDGCPGSFRVFDMRRIRRSLVEMYKTLCTISDCEHDHNNCIICSVNPRGCLVVKRDIQKLMDENVFQIQQSRDIDDVNVIVPVFKTPERVVIQFVSSNSNNVNKSVSPLV
ncbi:hypothetical protein KIW84_062407 [Lathyrus oleraceus]|uniref:Uncharacterized protein n=1 Tax=Pisum sativum TaxID=3888 RepID=A0A9D4W6U1_PEA|nr:hypothetical protein KIW84_062407 [Pisum sativum]